MIFCCKSDCLNINCSFTRNYININDNTCQ
uniref:Uncharacterized protein n=1 Tax=virus sp. cti5L29 TaxID=2826813 RepID=A0A8S5R9C5_9VIRU|nr:MAG TPA: hypothetical protein [virus sp. cti5L29]